MIIEKIVDKYLDKHQKIYDSITDKEVDKYVSKITYGRDFFRKDPRVRPDAIKDTIKYIKRVIEIIKGYLINDIQKSEIEALVHKELKDLYKQHDTIDRWPYEAEQDAWSLMQNAVVFKAGKIDLEEMIRRIFTSLSATLYHIYSFAIADSPYIEQSGQDRKYPTKISKSSWERSLMYPWS